jgi:uncharacterized protein involved in exopolysaccharide biosynthesis
MLRSQLAAAKARYAPDHPDIPRLQRELAGLEQDEANQQVRKTPADANSAANDLRRNLERAQGELAQARQKYGPEHPDRMRLEREVSQLQAELAAAPAPVAPPAADSPVPLPGADNPAYVQIQAQLAATLNELKALDAETKKLRAQADSFQRDIRLAPQVEQQYRELTRDYDNTRLKYQELRSKMSEAKTAQNLEADRKGERFTLIDPPLPPEEPVTPNRPMIFIGGLVLSLGLAVALVWLLEVNDTSVRGRVDLVKLTGIPPLALVPYIGTDAERRAGRRQLRLALGSAMATACLAVVLIHVFYRPLDVLWFTFARRFGL